MVQKNNMAMASMVTGILSIVLSCCCFLGFLFGGLAIMFACLSRVDDRFEGNAKAGLITGIIGIALGVIGIFLWILLIALAPSSDTYSDIYGQIPQMYAWFGGGFL